MTEDQYQVPDWDAAGRVHDWRNYISDELRVLWYGFLPYQRTAIGRSAEVSASNEEWE